jgi:hypothetical protein
MRKYFIATAVALLILPGPVLASEAAIDMSAQRFEVGPGGLRIGPERGPEDFRGRSDRGRGGLCAELRAACLNADRLGERGAGNCRRYRSTCR